jgi:uncharacterized low-complexity protein
MKRTLTILTALVFAGAMALPAFAQSESGSSADNPSSTSASSSASTSETKNGVTTTHQNSAHQEMGTTGEGKYSERSSQQFEKKENSSSLSAPDSGNATMPGNSGANPPDSGANE